MDGIASPRVGNDEVDALKSLALDGALDGEIKISCAALADDLDTSNQTASRRLQALENAGLLERETVRDGQWVSLTDDGERLLHRRYEQYRTLFDGRSSVTLEGTVTGGMGEGRHYISLPGYMAQFEAELGFAPFAGTLNVDLTAESTRTRGAMDAFEPIEIEGWADEERTYGGAVCYPATLETDDGDRYDRAHVIAPDRTHHDEDHLELIAPEKLRDVLGLDDGDHLSITVEEAS